MENEKSDNVVVLNPTADTTPEPPAEIALHPFHKLQMQNFSLREQVLATTTRDLTTERSKFLTDLAAFLKIPAGVSYDFNADFSKLVKKNAKDSATNTVNP